MIIKVLGSGCAKCATLEKVVRQAVDELGLDATVEHVTDFSEVMAYGVMATPALVVDEELRLSGRVPSVADVKSLLGRA